MNNFLHSWESENIKRSKGFWCFAETRDCKFSRQPRYVLLRYPKFFCSLSLANFDRCHSLCLALSAPGGARQRPLLRYPKFFCSLSLANFDRCHSLCLALSATGSARQRPHFDMYAVGEQHAVKLLTFQPDYYITIVVICQVVLKTLFFY